jgi:hypothetical protein
MTDQIAALEVYKGCPIHDCQGPERVEIVRREIDAVFALTDTAMLLRYCWDVTRPPEGRLLAAAKIEASCQIAAGERRTRPAVDLDYVRALVAGLTSRGWRSSSHYGCLFDHPRMPGEAGSTARTPEDRQAVEDDQRRLSDEERAAR